MRESRGPPFGPVRRCGRVSWPRRAGVRPGGRSAPPPAGRVRVRRTGSDDGCIGYPSRRSSSSTSRCSVVMASKVHPSEWWPVVITRPTDLTAGREGHSAQAARSPAGCAGLLRGTPRRRRPAGVPTPATRPSWRAGHDGRGGGDPRLGGRGISGCSVDCTNWMRDSSDGWGRSMSGHGF